MGMAATLVMWPGLFEQTFIPPSHEDSIWNSTLTGKGFWCLKSVDDGQTDRWRTTEAYLSCKLTSEPLAQVS